MQRTLWIIPLPQDEWMSKTVAAGNTSDASNKNNCPCSNNQHVNCSSLQDGGGNKRLGMTLFTSADCFKKRRESRASLSAVSGEKKGTRERMSERREERRGRMRRKMERNRRRERRRGLNSGEKNERERGWELLQPGWKTPLRERARLLYWSGLKSILETIVCNSDEKAAR